MAGVVSGCTVLPPPLSQPGTTTIKRHHIRRGQSVAGRVSFDHHRLQLHLRRQGQLRHERRPALHETADVVLVCDLRSPVAEQLVDATPLDAGHRWPPQTPAKPATTSLKAPEPAQAPSGLPGPDGGPEQRAAKKKPGMSGTAPTRPSAPTGQASPTAKKSQKTPLPASTFHFRFLNYFRETIMFGVGTLASSNKRQV